MKKDRIYKKRTKNNTKRKNIQRSKKRYNSKRRSKRYKQDGGAFTINLPFDKRMIRYVPRDTPGEVMEEMRQIDVTLKGFISDSKFESCRVIFNDTSFCLKIKPFRGSEIQLEFSNLQSIGIDVNQNIAILKFYNREGAKKDEYHFKFGTSQGIKMFLSKVFMRSIMYDNTTFHAEEIDALTEIGFKSF